MELQLGLAQPIMKGFDLNFHDFDPETEVGCSIKHGPTNVNNTNGDEITQTLPLLLWNDQPNQEEDNPNGSGKNYKNDGDGGAIIGWPPVRNLKKKRQCRFVKVKMEGEGITRKIDLNRFCSYPTLSHTLIAMFGKCKENVKNYDLTYQDSEGDWLLVGDVPWRSFNESAKRIRLLRRND